MVLGFIKHVWGKHNYFIKLGGSTIGFIGESLVRAKVLRFFFFFFSLFHMFVVYYGVSIGIRSG
jgi:hypothetical protein